MERSVVSVLTLVTLVTATPHGYGVKGGAFAKAEASAVAGAFGNPDPLPLSIPSGSAYSGSFSKSSSSSFASSSASSSSSSYSFSGSGANGITGIGTDKGCSSGSCPGVGATGPSLNGGNQLTGASAAQAKALSGSYAPCQGSNCNGSPADKCSSGHCDTNSAAKEQNGCTENCQQQEPELAIGESLGKGKNNAQEGNDNDTNDFSVNINRNPESKPSHDSNGQYSKEKPYHPESSCSNGKCGPAGSGQSSLKGNHNTHPVVPSTFLTTPNENPPCTTSYCNSPSQSYIPQTSGLPSSYNVPIQSATNPPTTYYSPPSSHGNQATGSHSDEPCTSPNCKSTPYSVGASNNPSNQHYGHQGATKYAQGPCTTGRCDISPSSNGKTSNSAAASGITVPTYSHGNVLSSAPSGYSGQPGCTTPYCAGLPSYSSVPSNSQGSGCSGTACSGASPIKHSDSNAPVYTGGFGGPAGFLEKVPESNKLPGHSAYDYGHNNHGANKPSFASSPQQGSLGATNANDFNSNNHYGHTQSSSNGESTGNFEYNKPSNIPSTPGSQFNPSITGNYGAPTGSAAQPQGSIPHTENSGIYKPTTSYPGSSPAGDIDSSTGSSHTNTGSNSIHGSFGIAKPNIPLNSQNSPTYTGNFGGSTGTLGGSNLSFGSTGSSNKPNGNCGSAVCNSHPSGGATSHGNSPGTSTSSQNKPTYTGGFGGPTGFLNPNENVPANNPTESSGNIPCRSGTCGPKATPSSNQGHSLTSTQSLAAATASANAEVYSGGFGGPPGVLKPYDDGKIPAQGNPFSGHSLSSNNGHPDAPSAPSKNSEPGSSGPEISEANGGAHASAVASATAGSYSASNQNKNGASQGCNSGCNPSGAGDNNFGFPDGPAKTGLGAGALASAKSIAGANAYGGNFASSSASAHASAGTATKGGYGRK